MWFGGCVSEDLWKQTNEFGVNMYQSVHSAKLQVLLYSVGQAACLVLHKTPEGKVQVQSLLRTFKELLLCAEV